MQQLLSLITNNKEDNMSLSNEQEAFKKVVAESGAETQRIESFDNIRNVMGRIQSNDPAVMSLSKQIREMSDSKREKEIYLSAYNGMKNALDTGQIGFYIHSDMYDEYRKEASQKSQTLANVVELLHSQMSKEAAQYCRSDECWNPNTVAECNAGIAKIAHYKEQFELLATLPGKHVDSTKGYINVFDEVIRGKQAYSEILAQKDAILTRLGTDKKIAEIVRSKEKGPEAIKKVADHLEELGKQGQLKKVDDTLYKLENGKYEFALDKLAGKVPSEGESYMFVPKIAKDGKPIMQDGVMVQDMLVFRDGKLAGAHIFNPQSECSIGPKTLAAANAASVAAEKKVTHVIGSEPGESSSDGHVVLEGLTLPKAVPSKAIKVLGAEQEVREQNVTVTPEKEAVEKVRKALGDSQSLPNLSESGTLTPPLARSHSESSTDRTKGTKVSRSV